MSTLKVDTIESKTINGDITVSSPLVGDGSGLTNLPSQTANDFTNTLKTKLDNVEANATTDQTKTDIEALGIDISGTMSGHIIPGTNSVYDIGSAEYKVRHLFLSDNSLWVGDDHKVTVEGGKKKYKKRKKGIVPAGVQTFLITSVFADTAALLINFKAQIHDPAPSNELDPDHADFNPPTSKWQEFLVLHGHPNKSVDDIYNTATDFDDEKEETDKATAEGDIVYFDGSVYRRLPLGSEGQVLLANGDGTAPEWAAPAAGGAWEYVSTSSGNATSRSFRNIFSWSTYPCWMFVFNGIAMDNAGGGLGVQFYDASDVLSTSGYQWNYAVLNSGSSSWSVSNSNSDTFMHLSNNPSNAAPLWCNLLVWYGGTRNMVTADCIWDHTHGNNYFGRSVAGGRKGGFASTGIYFKQWAGVFQGGDIYAYRLKKS